MSFDHIWQQYIKWLYAYLPKGKHTTCIGIDIGTRAIKAVEISNNPSGYQLHQAVVVELTSLNIKQALQKIIQEFKIKNQRVIVSVSGKGTLIRYIEMPRMPVEQLRGALTYELDKYFPFDPSTIYFDCHILTEQIQEKKMSVLVAATRKELVDERIKLFKELGVDLYAVTINAVATANAFVKIQELAPAGASQALLDIGGMVSSLMVLDQGIPRFTRDIFIGGQEIKKQACNAWSVKEEIFEEYLSTDVNADVAVAAESVLQNLINEVRLSLDYYMTEKNILVDTLWITGGSVQMRGIKEYLAANLGIPVHVWVPLAGFKVDPALAEQSVLNQSSQFSVAVGLALGGL